MVTIADVVEKELLDLVIEYQARVKSEESVRGRVTRVSRLDVLVRRSPRISGEPCAFYSGAEPVNAPGGCAPF